MLWTTKGDLSGLNPKFGVHRIADSTQSEVEFGKVAEQKLFRMVSSINPAQIPVRFTVIFLSPFHCVEIATTPPFPTIRTDDRTAALVLCSSRETRSGFI